MGEPRTISVVVPNYNGERLLAQYLPSVLAACRRYPGETEVLVVDDCSTDDSLAVLEGYGGDVSVLRAEENGGFSKTCNLGIRAARCELIFLLNSDVRIAPDFFDGVSAHFDDPSCFAVTPLGRRMEDDSPLDACVMYKWRGGSLRHSVMFFEEDLRELGVEPPYKSARVQGAYFVADGEKLRALGGFDPIYSPYYWEETDLSYRALKRGWHIVFEPRCVAWHEVGTSIAGKNRSFYRRSMSKRNRVLFHLINIHSARYLAPFLLALFLNALLLRPTIWRATWMCLPLLPAAWRSRRRAQRESVRSDREVARLVGDFFRPLEAPGDPAREA